MSAATPEYPLLILDASSRRTWVGLKRAADQLSGYAEPQDPSKSLFRLVEKALRESRLQLSNLASIAYCAGPGSMLGARTVCMAIRAWQGIGIPAADKAFSYSSLQLGAALAAASPACKNEGLVATDARQSSWNVLPFPLKTDDSAETSLVPNDVLENESRQIVSFSEFPVWTKSRIVPVLLSYDPGLVFGDDTFIAHLRPQVDVAPLATRQNEYKKWQAKIHATPEQ